MKRRYYAMIFPREGKEVNLIFEGEGVKLSCSQMERKFEIRRKEKK